MSNNFKSYLYSNAVIHQRFSPLKHKFKYSFISFYIDYDELNLLDKKITFFSYNKFNLFSFYDIDHGYRDKRSLKKYVERILSRNLIKYNKLHIRILCFPRILGYVFNPLSIIFCFDNNKLIAILYEVKNTSNEQHTYCFANKKNITKSKYIHKCNKMFYVSPFIEMNCYYKFITKVPSKNLFIFIEQYNNKQKIFFASQIGKRIKITSSILFKSFFQYPLMSIKIILGIHYEAFRIFLKGGKYYSRKKKPVDTFSYEGKL